MRLWLMLLRNLLVNIRFCYQVILVLFFCPSVCNFQSLIVQEYYLGVISCSNLIGEMLIRSVMVQVFKDLRPPDNNDLRAISIIHQVQFRFKYIFIMFCYFIMAVIVTIFMYLLCGSFCSYYMSSEICIYMFLYRKYYNTSFAPQQVNDLFNIC